MDRITRDPEVMGGRPCIRGLRVTVGTVVGLLAAGHDEDEVLDAYPYLELDDIRQTLAYAAWRSEEEEVAVGTGARRHGFVVLTHDRLEEFVDGYRGRRCPGNR